jgi:hypothetical protein
VLVCSRFCQPKAWIVARPEMTEMKRLYSGALASIWIRRICEPGQLPECERAAVSYARTCREVCR